MAATFEVLQDNVIVNRYTEPLTPVDIQDMTVKDDDYANNHASRIHVLSDFSQIKNFPSGLLTMGLRTNLNNPIRNPKIASIVVVCSSPFLTQLAAVISRVAHIDKLNVVKDLETAMHELDKLTGAQVAREAYNNPQHAEAH